MVKYRLGEKISIHTASEGGDILDANIIEDFTNFNPHRQRRR